VIDILCGSQNDQVLNTAPREVHLVGDLDLWNRESVTSSCLAGDEPMVTVNLSRVGFMDCAGYGALLDVRAELGRRGQAMTLVGATGEPARLIQLITDLGVYPKVF